MNASNTIDMVNRLVRTASRMTRQIGHQPTPEELAHELAIPVDTVLRLWRIATVPVRLNS
jgi:RNA polymerase primary sigma factor